MNTPSNSPTDYTALVGATIYVSPTEPAIRDGVVLIQGEKIVSVRTRAQMQFPETAHVIDCFGLTITAGLWNSHVHFFERKWADVANIPAPELGRQLRDMLTKYGFTSVFASEGCVTKRSVNLSIVLRRSKVHTTGQDQ